MHGGLDSMFNSEELIDIFKDNVLAFMVGYTLATGELHLIIADLLSL